jgi:hypothetical protein
VKAAPAFASLLLLAWAGPARAQLKDCVSFDPQHAAGYTMFLDDVVRPDRSSAAATVEQASLAALIAEAHDALHLTRGGSGPSIEWKTCVGRAPKLGDFTPRVRRDLLQYRVVLEIYGNSDGRHMELRHAVIPAMYDEDDDVVQKDVVPLAGEPDDDGVEVNRYRAHLLGYMEVALALREVLAVGQLPAQEVERQLARRWMCDGIRLIFGGGARPPTTLAPDQAILLDTLARHMAGFSSSPAYDQVQGLLHHGAGSQPVDVVALFKNACLGPRS